MCSVICWCCKSKVYVDNNSDKHALINTPRHPAIIWSFNMTTTIFECHHANLMDRSTHHENKTKISIVNILAVRRDCCSGLVLQYGVENWIDNVTFKANLLSWKRMNTLQRGMLEIEIIFSFYFSSFDIKHGRSREDKTCCNCWFIETLAAYFFLYMYEFCNSNNEATRASFFETRQDCHFY
jgi:hypothetical protein